jgi:hypothetical protein
LENDTGILNLTSVSSVQDEAEESETTSPRERERVGGKKRRIIDYDE